MIREIAKPDQAVYMELSEEFYHTPGVLHAIPKEHYQSTFDEVTSHSPFAKAYLIEQQEAVAGYALLSFTYSNEAGGIVLWIEELYIRPAFQGLGLGTALFRYLLEQYQGKVARIRLEIEPANRRAKKLYEKLGFQDIGYESMVLDFNREKRY